MYPEVETLYLCRRLLLCSWVKMLHLVSVLTADARCSNLTTYYSLLVNPKLYFWSFLWFYLGKGRGHRGGERKLRVDRGDWKLKVELKEKLCVQAEHWCLGSRWKVWLRAEKRAEPSSQLSMTLFWLVHGGGIREVRRQHLGKAATNIRRVGTISKATERSLQATWRPGRAHGCDTVLLEQKKRNLEGGDGYCSGQNRCLYYVTQESALN